MTPLPLQEDFARLAGELAESLSFNRSIGQIYGLLYLASEPLSLEDIANRLGMSKGNASINLRALASWGAVRPVWVRGSRRDHYEADRNIKALALRRLEEGLSRRLDLAEDKMDRILSRLNQDGAALDPAVKKRLQELRSLVGSGRKALRVLPKILGFLAR